VFAALVVGGDSGHRLFATAITTVSCFGVGLLTSEVLFGWATEADLQPNVDGLSRDEVLLSSLLTTAVVVVVMRYLAHRAEGKEVIRQRPPSGARASRTAHRTHLNVSF
jgi:hypothetical protein